MLTVHLPWPPKQLSPNARNNWRAVAGAKKKYRRDCGWASTAAGLRHIDADGLRLKVTFFPPDARVRDRDNAIAAFKAAQDAIADVTGIDDAKFEVSYAPLATPIRPRGMVKVELDWSIETREEK